MMSLASFVSVSLVLLHGAHAHFTLNYPATIGFDDDLEGTAPCGSFTPNFSADNITNFHVDGDAVYTSLFHPQSNFLYRGTLDTTASSNWTQLFPIVSQTGLGDLCEPSITAPANWVGKQGIIGVVVDGPDGILYQCAAVNFVNGTTTVVANSDNCQNGTVTVAFTADPTLAAMVGSGNVSNSSTTGTTSTTSSSAAASSTSAGSPALASYSFPMGSILVTAAMVLVGVVML